MYYLLIFLFLLALTPLGAVAEEVAGSRHVNVGENDLALQGYDPVSYFSGTPELGKPDYSLVHAGGKYHFIDQESMAQFKAAPEKYLPAYGGWCAWAMLDGEKVEVNPERFKIIAGINYLFYDGFWGNTLKKWNKRATKKGETGLIQIADMHWKDFISE